MNYRDRITLNPDILAGKPIIRGTRIAVEFVVGLFADGWSETDVLGNYPNLTREDLLACLQYAGEMMRSEKVYPLTADGT